MPHLLPIAGAIIFIVCLTSATIYITIRTTQEQRRDKIRNRIRRSPKEAQRLLHPTEAQDAQADGDSRNLIQEPRDSPTSKETYHPTWTQYWTIPNVANRALAIEARDSTSKSTYDFAFKLLQPRDSNIPHQIRKHKFNSLLALGYAGVLHSISSDEPLGYVTRPFSSHLPKIHIAGRCTAAHTIEPCALEAHMRYVTRHPRNGRLEFGFKADAESGTGIERTYHWQVSKWIPDYGTDDKRPLKRVQDMELWEDGAFLNRAEGLAATWSQLRGEKGGVLSINEAKARDNARLGDGARDRFIAMVICTGAVIFDNVDQFGFCEESFSAVEKGTRKEYLDVPERCEGCGSCKVFAA